MTNFIKTPFAQSGDKTVPPETDASGGVNWTQGYPGAYSKDPATDPSAKRIERESFNGVLNKISVAVNELQTTGLAPYIEAADNGGSTYTYKNGVMVYRDGVVYQSTKDNNNTVPTAAGAAWEPVPAKIQPYADKLAAFASVDNAAANRVPYYTSDTDITTASFTQTGRDVVGKASLDELKTYLGINVIQGRLLKVLLIDTSRVYNPTTGTRFIVVEAIGAGGASGNTQATGAGEMAVTAAGSNGAYAKAQYTTGFAGITVTVGVGGTPNGGGGGTGGNGSATTFGSLMTCPGGKGSAVGIAKAPPFNQGAASPSGLPSASGLLYGASSPYSPWPVAVQIGQSTNFTNSIQSQLGGYGMGGDGLASDPNEATKSGNAGKAGVVVVWEYS